MISRSSSSSTHRKQAIPNNIKHISQSSISDDEGWKRAYNTNQDVYTPGDTLYVSGTNHADALLDTVPVDIFNHIKANKYQDMIDDLKFK